MFEDFYSIQSQKVDVPTQSRSLVSIPSSHGVFGFPLVKVQIYGNLDETIYPQAKAQTVINESCLLYYLAFLCTGLFDCTIGYVMEGRHNHVQGSQILKLAFEISVILWI